MFRVGCAGCLTGFALLASVAGAGWGVYEMMRRPESPAVTTSASDGLRAQQKIFDVLRSPGSGRSRTVALSEREVNGFLRRHLADEADLPLREIVVHLSRDGEAEIVGQLPLRQVLASPPFSAIPSVLPQQVRERGVWLTVVARVTLESADTRGERRRLRLDVVRFRLGRARLPEPMMRLLLDPSILMLLRWPMPRGLEDLRIEPGRLILHAGA